MYITKLFTYTNDLVSRKKLSYVYTLVWFVFRHNLGLVIFSFASGGFSLNLEFVYWHGHVLCPLFDFEAIKIKVDVGVNNRSHYSNHIFILNKFLRFGSDRVGSKGHHRSYMCKGIKKKEEMSIHWINTSKLG